ncbi:hypothetical protein ACQR16_27025 [Bradyrhizobium oligotrophicum]|uniref:hypothetical protein n=1 Tax=Bradyrhizobium oligotrophicum TaxID=44255 RepID=UPI003EBB3C00
MMDKPSFIKRGPEYYALALALGVMQLRNSLFTLNQLQFALTREDEGFRQSFNWPALVNAGMRVLIEADVIEMTREDFGPHLYRCKPLLTWEWIFEGEGRKIPIFARYAEVQNLSWLAEALVDVDHEYSRLALTSDDFEEPVPSLWEPLPLDRSDENLREVTKKVDEAVSQIAADNGYAANMPGERDYVVQSLRAFSSSRGRRIQPKHPQSV